VVEPEPVVEVSGVTSRTDEPLVPARRQRRPVAVIQAIDRGEDYLNEEFERVLKDEAIGTETQAVVRQAHDSVRHGLRLVEQLKQQSAA